MKVPDNCFASQGLYSTEFIKRYQMGFYKEYPHPQLIPTEEIRHLNSCSLFIPNWANNLSDFLLIEPFNQHNDRYLHETLILLRGW